MIFTAAINNTENYDCSKVHMLIAHIYFVLLAGLQSRGNFDPTHSYSFPKKSGSFQLLVLERVGKRENFRL